MREGEEGGEGEEEGVVGVGAVLVLPIPQGTSVAVGAVLRRWLYFISVSM
jgi:hypothetical protein